MPFRSSNLRRASYGSVLILLVSFAGGRLVWAESASKINDRPNIIVIFTEDQTYRAIGYNAPAVKTPHLDALAASVIAFDQAYVASPICAASRASMMTGLPPSSMA